MINFARMKPFNDYTLNIRGKLFSLREPVVMGILNATPDSFFAASRVQTADEIAKRAHQIIAEGGKMIDVGACSTRPGGDVCTEEEEMERLRKALPIVREAEPDAVVSLDTFRASIARECVEHYGVDIINDVACGEDPDMFGTVAQLQVPYILMSLDSNTRDICMTFARKVQELRDLKAKDIILDPGVGFGKDVKQNYEVLRNMDKLQVFGLPILVGMSRKRMIHQLLGITANESLNGTTVVNTLSLLKGASILRVHDVKEAVQATTIVSQMLQA